MILKTGDIIKVTRSRAPRNEYRGVVKGFVVYRNFANQHVDEIDTNKLSPYSNSLVCIKTKLDFHADDWVGIHPQEDVVILQDDTKLEIGMAKPRNPYVKPPYWTW